MTRAPRPANDNARMPWARLIAQAVLAFFAVWIVLAGAMAIFPN